MKNLCSVLILFVCFSTFGQELSGTYKNKIYKPDDLKYLRLNQINDTLLIFAFSNDTIKLDFNWSNDFGVCNLKNGVWVGLIDYSPTIWHEYGEFDVKEKK